MAQLVLGVAGAAIGGLVGGPVGAQVGWALGSLVGSQLGPRQRVQGPRLEDLKVTGLEYGAPIPLVFGVTRVAGSIWWASEKIETATTTEAGKNSGPEYTEYSYSANVLYGLCDNEIEGVQRIWWNGRLVYTARDGDDPADISASEDGDWWERMTVYNGDVDRLPDPVYEAAVGSSNAVGYRGRACLFIEGLQLGNSGVFPNLTFEVVVRGSQTSATRLQTYFDGDDSSDISGYGNGPGTIEGAYASVSSGGFTVTTPYNPPGAPDVGVQQLSWQVPSLGVVIPSPVTVEFFFTLRATRNVSYDALVTYRSNYSNVPNFRIGAQGSAGNLVFDTATFGLDYVTSEGYTGQGRVHVAVVSNGTNETRIYIQGVQRTSTNAPIGNNSTGVTGSLVLGSVIYGSGAAYGDALDYTIDEFRVVSEEVYTGTSFEVPEHIALAGARIIAGEQTLREVVDDLCERAGMPPDLYDNSALDAITRPVRALAIVPPQTTRSVLEMLAQAFALEANISDKLRVFPRQTTPVESIPYSALGVGADESAGEPFSPTVSSDLELPAQVSVRYLNTTADQQTGVEHSDRLLSAQAALRAVDLPLGLTPAEAKAIADGMVIDASAGAVRVSVSVGLEYAHLEPGDVIAVDDAVGVTWRLRIVRRSEAPGVITFECVSDDDGALTSEEITDETYTEGQIAGPTVASELEILDVPLLRDGDDAPGHYVAARGVDDGRWPGAVVFRSIGGSAFASVATVAEAAVFGVTETTLPAWGGSWGTDTTSTVDVDVGAGELSSATIDALQSDRTLNVLLIGSEIIRFRTATLLAPGRYRLSNLWRAQLGTEWAAASHSAGERVVLLRPQGLRDVQHSAADYGVEASLKAVTRGKAVDSVDAEAVTINGIRQKPFAPVDVRASTTSVGVINLSWIRRSRYQTRVTGGMSAPLGETSERYEVDVVRVSDSTVLRTIETASPDAAYTQAMQSADGTTLGEELRFDVYQIGAIGRGYPGSVTADATITGQGQEVELTLSGTFASGVEITVSINGTIYTYTTIVGDTNLQGVATSLATLLDGEQGLTATASGAVVTLSSDSGPFTVGADVEGGTTKLTRSLVQHESVGGTPKDTRIIATINPLTPELSHPSSVFLQLRRLSPSPQQTFNFRGDSISGSGSFRQATTQFAYMIEDIMNGIGEANILSFGIFWQKSVYSMWGVDFYYPADQSWDVLWATDRPDEILTGWSLTPGSDGAARARIVSVTYSETPVAGWVYRIVLSTVADGEDTFDYTAVGGDTVNDIASELASLINAGAGSIYTASASGGTLTIELNTTGVRFESAARVIKSAFSISVTTTQQAG